MSRYFWMGPSLLSVMTLTRYQNTDESRRDTNQKKALECRRERPQISRSIRLMMTLNLLEKKQTTWFFFLSWEKIILEVVFWISSCWSMIYFPPSEKNSSRGARVLNKSVLGDPVICTLRHCVTDGRSETWQLFFSKRCFASLEYHRNIQSVTLGIFISSKFSRNYGFNG